MNPLKLLTFHLVCLTVSLTLSSAITQAEDKLKITEAETQPSQGGRFIQFVNEQLTCRLARPSQFSRLADDHRPR